METVLEKQKTVKHLLSDILLDISWARLSKNYFGKSSSWIYHKLDGIDSDFSYSEKLMLKNALCNFSDRIRKAAERIDI